MSHVDIDWVAPNWIADRNRYNLPAPPTWFLKRLYDYDAALVIIPSRNEVVVDESPAYLLCRRRQLSAGIGDVALLSNKHPDTNMCYEHGVVPVAPLRFNNGVRTFTANGCDSLITELKRRDIWALSGGAQNDSDAVADAVEYAEDLAYRKERAAFRDKMHHMARDAYRSLQARMGWRNKSAHDINRHAKKGGSVKAPAPRIVVP